MSVARVLWNVDEKRYELVINGILKAYSEPVGEVNKGYPRAAHEEGKKELVRMAKEKRYTVIGE